MGGTRAHLTIRGGTVYVNDANIAQSFLASLVPSLSPTGINLTTDSDDVKPALVESFKQRVKAVAAEVADQIAFSASTQVPWESGGMTYRVARASAPRMANSFRSATRASGRAKHDMKEVVSDHASNDLELSEVKQLRTPKEPNESTDKMGGINDEV